MNSQNSVCWLRTRWKLLILLFILQWSVIWHSKSKLQPHVESILIRNVAAFLSLLQFGIHKYFMVEKLQSNEIHFSFMQCYGDYVWFNHECSQSTPLQELFSFSPFLLPESHADWVTISVTEWLIDLSGDRERGCARGDREDVWQLAVNDPCHSLLSIQTPAPPICLSEVPLDKSWVTSNCRWEWALFNLQKKWASLDHLSHLSEGGAFFSSWISSAEWCAWLFDILISLAALRSAGIPAWFPVADKMISVATKTFLIDSSFYGCPRMNARFWWKRPLFSSTILVFSNTDQQCWESGTRVSWLPSGGRLQ